MGIIFLQHVLPLHVFFKIEAEQSTHTRSRLVYLQQMLQESTQHTNTPETPQKISTYM